jgi:hypothetical protein
MPDNSDLTQRLTSIWNTLLQRKAKEMGDWRLLAFQQPLSPAAANTNMEELYRGMSSQSGPVRWQASPHGFGYGFQCADPDGRWQAFLKVHFGPPVRDDGIQEVELERLYEQAVNDLAALMQRAESAAAKVVVAMYQAVADLTTLGGGTASAQTVPVHVALHVAVEPEKK